jgi:protein tyrosine phosphatase (PTP) superfamily phosphohydrolase (DUF442 family)
MAAAIVTLRRRTELKTLVDKSHRIGLNVLSFCRSGARAAWGLTGEGGLYTAGAMGEQHDAVSPGR